MKKTEPAISVLRPLDFLRSESGISLLLVLIAMTILGLSAAVAGMSWSSLTRRAREADLLWKGGQIRNAIGSYYRTSHGQGAPNIYPSKLEYLLKDPRSLQTKRHLRRLYADPMTGRDWVLIKDQGGRIKGVRSSLEKEPFKLAQFSAENQDFEGRTSYREWEFIYVPQNKNPAATPQPVDKGGSSSPAGEAVPPGGKAGTPPGQVE